MAPHLNSLMDLAPCAVDKANFWSRLRPGRLLYCNGSEEISDAIEDACKSLLSHIAMIVQFYGTWCVIEAVWPHGVVITPAEHYIENYEGTLILCRRVDPAGNDVDETPSILEMRKHLGEDYAASGLVKQGLHLIFKGFPPECSDRQIYCSGLQNLGSLATSAPFYPNYKIDGQPSPEQLYVHPSNLLDCALLYQAAKEVA